MIHLNPTDFPISRSHSYLSFVLQKEEHYVGPSISGPGLYLRSTHNTPSKKFEILKIEILQDGSPVEASLRGFPGGVELYSTDGTYTVRLAIETHEDEDSVLIEGNVGLRLTAGIIYGVIGYPLSERACEVVPGANGISRIRLSLHSGRYELDAPWAESGTNCERVVISLEPDPKSGTLDAVLDCAEKDILPRTHATLPHTVEATQSELDQFLSPLPSVADEWKETRDLAGTILWNNTMRPGGRLTRPTIVVSKNIMVNAWSWDNIFNTVGLADSHPELAWEQVLVFADQMTESGAQPDVVNRYTVDFSFCKPPVLGVLFDHCQKLNPDFFYQPQVLSEVTRIMEAQTRWWLDNRRLDGRAIPYYIHGNDSGWDTSTLFTEGTPIECPDLATYLILQCEKLAELVRDQNPEGADKWTAESEKLLEALIAQQWSEEKGVFHANRYTGTGFVKKFAQSGLTLKPALLGKRLPESIQRALLNEVKRYRTDWGIASEHPQSPLYVSYGHWRGPLWAPFNYFMAYGLEALGDAEAARDLAHAYCKAVRETGCYENIDSLTGKAQREWAMSWTAAVFIRLATDLAS